MAISKDFFDKDLPKPELSKDEEYFADRFSWAPSWASCFGGASFLMFTILSTIFVPIITGFTSSLSLEDL